MEVQAHDASDLLKLQKLIRAEKRAVWRDRFRMVLLALQGKTAPEIARKVFSTRRTVQIWVYRYRDEGLDGLTRSRYKGSRPKLTPAQESAFKARLDAGPTEADGECTLRGRTIQRILEEEFNVSYSLPGVYDLLHRLNYSCLQPRPRHEMNDPEAMQAFKDAAPLFSRRSKTSTRISESKSSSRMRPASASRER